MSNHAPVLLNFARYSGTLAATRCLGGLGVPVTVADPGTLAAAKWSRYVTRRESCPPVQETDAFLDWLIDFGRRNPGHVLCATSDDMTWLMARYRDALLPYYHLHSPSLDSVKQVLDKESLHAIANQVGIATPKTHCPKNEANLRAIADAVQYPVLFKLRTQVLRPYANKGQVIHNREQLLWACREFVEKSGYSEDLLREQPDVCWPMIQEYCPDAPRNIYTLSGFVDRTGQLHDFRACRKILQYPQRLGIGVCFEGEQVDTELRDKMLALCRTTGYWGLVQAELIETQNGERLLIDFNPRFYHGMWFEVVRGMPLPAFTYFAGLGDDDALRRAVEQSRLAGQRLQRASAVQGSRFFSMLAAKGVTGAWPPGEVRKWTDWYRRRRGARYDLITSKDDYLPAVVDAVTMVSEYAMHPGTFVRTMIRNA